MFNTAAVESATNDNQELLSIEPQKLLDRFPGLSTV